MLTQLLKKVMHGENLTADEARFAMTEIMTGQAGEVRTAGLLVALAMKGETGEEIESFARSMRQAAAPWNGYTGKGRIAWHPNFSFDHRV